MNILDIKFFPVDDTQKNMSNGNRDMSRTPLTEDEISLLKKEILAINADLSIFVFNHPDYIKKGTCYEINKDLIFITRNVFPDMSYSYNVHPRDLMSPRAVIAHEYYGHRSMRDRYIKELNEEIDTMPLWRDEALASISAAFYTPNLERSDRVFLINDALKRANEAGHIFETTPEMKEKMKEMMYGKWEPSERNIVPVDRLVFFHRLSGGRRKQCRRNKSPLPKM